VLDWGLLMSFAMPVFAHPLIASHLKGTIFFIALCAVFIPTVGQTPSQNSPVAASEANAQEEKQERGRILTERQAANAAYEAKRRDCYQKLAVTPCLNEARDERNQKLNDLKRQEVALDDAKRKRRAVDKLREVESRSSPQAQQAQAERRGRAMQDMQDREQRQIKKQADREEKLRKAAEAPNKPETSAQEGPLMPQGRPRADKQAKHPPEQRTGQAEKIAESRAAADKREKELAERRAKAAQRQQEQEKKNKKPAATLPIPTN
jgi:colicin import membrane protein